MANMFQSAPRSSAGGIKSEPENTGARIGFNPPPAQARGESLFSPAYPGSHPVSIRPPLKRGGNLADPNAQVIQGTFQSAPRSSAGGILVTVGVPDPKPV